MKDWFILHQDVIAIKGVYHQGILCSIIKLKDRSTILVKRSPEEVIRDTIHYFGFYFTGDKFFQVRRGSRDLCPVEVNPFHNMCFFLHILLQRLPFNLVQCCTYRKNHFIWSTNKDPF